jgi:hypothetical protein
VPVPARLEGEAPRGEPVTTPAMVPDEAVAVALPKERARSRATPALAPVQPLPAEASD